ncbi:MAG: hypothetical protein KGZ35_00895 [Truepera sp.]|nr:hypothetical protein [Truepera sp.]
MTRTSLLTARSRVGLLLSAMLALLMAMVAACGNVKPISQVADDLSVGSSSLVLVEEETDPLMMHVDPEAFLKRLKARHEAQPSERAGVTPTRLAVDEAKERLSVWLPSYLPEGFTLAQSTVIVHDHLQLDAGAEPAVSVLFRSEGGSILEVLVAPLASGEPLRIPIGKAAAERIVIDRDTEGFLIRGRWVTRVNRTMEQVTSGWDAGAGTQITFTRGARLFEVTVNSSSITADELLKVAQSLKLQAPSGPP